MAGPQFRNSPRSISATEFMTAASQTLRGTVPISARIPYIANDPEKRKYMISPTDYSTPLGNDPKTSRLYRSPDPDSTFHGGLQPNELYIDQAGTTRRHLDLADNTGGKYIHGDNW